MRVLVQRVSRASVEVNGQQCGAIEKGLLVLLGIEEADTEMDADWICQKLANLRIMNDEKGVPNLSVLDTGGDVLLVSQFTLHAATKKGNRPSYIKAARPEKAEPLYQYCIWKLGTELGKPIQQGVFGAHMMVSLINDGPVTIWIDSKNKE